MQRGLHQARERTGLHRRLADQEPSTVLATGRAGVGRDPEGLVASDDGLRTTTIPNDPAVAAAVGKSVTTAAMLVVLSLTSPGIEQPIEGRRISPRPERDIESDDLDQQFRELYDRFAPRVHRYFLSRTHDREAADELTSATFQILWEHPDWSRTTDEVRRSLFNVAYRLLSNHRRALERHRQLLGRLSGLADARDEVTDHDATEDEELLAVPGLRPSEQAALRLIYWDQMSYVEAAKELQCTVNALAIILHRAHRKLARLLGPSAISSRGL